MTNSPYTGSDLLQPELFDLSKPSVVISRRHTQICSRSKPSSGFRGSKFDEIRGVWSLVGQDCIAFADFFHAEVP